MNVDSSNYNGDFLSFLYQVFDVGNEAVDKGAARVTVGIAKKRALPRLSQTENPLGDYTTGVPASESVTTTYAERGLEPKEMTLYEKFLPEDFQGAHRFRNCSGRVIQRLALVIL
jgi:hypothetical protein